MYSIESARITLKLKACHCCGLVHQIPELHANEIAKCTRCNSRLAAQNQAVKSSSRTAALTIAALALFLPGIFLPMLEIERLGHRHTTSLIGGIFDLLAHGNFAIGLVVLFFSIIFPLVKMTMLLELTLFEFFQRRHKAWVYQVMEYAGKWSMMDVLLLAFLVMCVKLGSLVDFRLGLGVWAFGGSVTASLLASLLFNPHAIWREEEQDLPPCKPTSP